ncbi:MAG: cryptochrome/photolyase family protein [Acidimicrobiales bacterium]
MADPTVFWFRRDLRLADHPALEEAAERGPVVGLFVLDPALHGPAGAARRAFLTASLRALDDSMGGALVVRSGRPATVVPAVAAEVGSEAVLVTEDFGPYGRRRDDEVAGVLADAGGTLERLGAPYAVPPGTVLTKAGTPYRVFSPFRRSWEETGWAGPGRRLAPEWCTGLDSDGIPVAPDVDADLPPAGERAAHERLDAFLADGVDRYDEERDRPDLDGTSRLSPYLKWGTLHPRQILDRLGSGAGTFRSELAWREFYADVLFHHPESARTALDEKMSAMELDHGERADERFEAWSRGHTGYPIVDAGMRQLLATGWMHNRVRMITASFLVKDLHIDWLRGARWFMEHLVDGDLASNNHGWQWVAGTGTDAAPYFRVFNPTSQGAKFDPDGHYIRTWIPELAGVADDHVHEPSTAPDGPPAGYPAPVVDHRRERQEALDRYRRLG